MQLPAGVVYKEKPNAEKEGYRLVGDVYTVLVRGAQTQGAYALFHAVMGAKSGPPLHVHSREDEAFYVLKGQVDFFIGGDHVIHAKGGDYVHLPKGLPHRFFNPTDQAADVLISVFPAGFEDFFAEAGTPVSSGQAEPPLDEMVARFERLFPKYGLAFG